MAGAGTMTDLRDDLLRSAQAERVSVGDIVDAFGARGHGPLLVIPALVAITPIGAIPGVPTLMATIVFLVAAQMLLARRSIWLPKILRKRSVSASRLRSALDATGPTFARIDRILGQRLSMLARPPFPQIAAVLCMALALTVPPLELFPFAAAAPMAVVVLFGLAILTRDGIIMSVALVLTSLIPVGAFFLI